MSDRASVENRLYSRYVFTAEAEIHSPSTAAAVRVKRIGFGGCSLLTNGPLIVGDVITIKIHTPNDSFAATAKIVHSTDNEAGIMFDKISAESLLVLQKWISTAEKP